MLKTIGNTIKNSITKEIGSSVKKSMSMFFRKKHSTNNFTFGLKKHGAKYLRMRHNIGNKYVKYLGEKRVHKFNYKSVCEAIQLIRKEGKKNTLMGSAKQMFGNGNKLRSLFNTMLKNKPYVPFLFVTGSVMGLTELKATPDPNFDHEQLDMDSSQSFQTKEAIRQYEIIRQMRKKKDAVVDIQGVGRFVAKDGDQDRNAFQQLANTILSVQSNDKHTDKVFERLLQEEGGVTIEKYANLSYQEMEDKISDMNHKKKKAIYIKDVAVRIRDELKGKVPNTLEGLQKFKGVGPKVALITLEGAFRKTEGIAVDTHVHRISNILKWVDAKTPEKTMIQLQNLFPKKYWRKINKTVVGFGQQICNARSPKCEICLLNKECSVGKIKLQKQKAKKG